MQVFSMLSYIAMLLITAIIGLTYGSALSPHNGNTILSKVIIDNSEHIDLSNPLNGTLSINEKDKKINDTLRFTYMLGDLEYLPKDVEDEMDSKLNAFQFETINKKILNSFYKLARKYNHTESNTVSANQNMTSFNPLVNNSSNTEHTLSDPEFSVPAGSKYIKYSGFMNVYEVKDVLDCISKMDRNERSIEVICDELAEDLLERDGIEDPNNVYNACLDAISRL